MSARPISFPYPADKSCAINIDFENNEYLLLWIGDWRKLPDLTLFPYVRDACVTLIPHSPSVHELWSRSQVLTYGADSHIRALSFCADDFPICKIGINDQQRRLLQEEFSILRSLSSTGAPVVRIHPEALTDEQGIFGFRMERLVSLTLETAAQHIPKIKKAIDEIHNSGIVHYDIGPSNILLNAEGFVRIIDFGRAGYIGHEVPAHKRTGSKTSTQAVFSISIDHNALQETIGVFPDAKSNSISRLTFLDIFLRKGCCS